MTARACATSSSAGFSTGGDSFRASSSSRLRFSGVRSRSIGSNDRADCRTHQPARRKSPAISAGDSPLSVAIWAARSYLAQAGRASALAPCGTVSVLPSRMVFFVFSSTASPNEPAASA